jgi:hypothetical protein
VTVAVLAGSGGPFDRDQVLRGQGSIGEHSGEEFAEGVVCLLCDAAEVLAHNCQLIGRAASEAGILPVEDVIVLADLPIDATPALIGPTTEERLDLPQARQSRVRSHIRPLVLHLRPIKFGQIPGHRSIAAVVASSAVPVDNEAADVPCRPILEQDCRCITGHGPSRRGRCRAPGAVRRAGRAPAALDLDTRHVALLGLLRGHLPRAPGITGPDFSSHSSEGRRGPPGADRCGHCNVGGRAS